MKPKIVIGGALALLVSLALAFLGGRSSVRVREVERRVLVTSEASQEARTVAYVGHVETKQATLIRWKVRTIVRVDGSSEREEIGEVAAKNEIGAAVAIQATEAKQENKETRDEVVKTRDASRPDYLFSVWASVDRDLKREYEATVSRRILGPMFVGLKVQRAAGWSAGVGVTAEY